MRKIIITFLIATLYTSMNLHAQDSATDQQAAELLESVSFTINGMACQEGCADVISANLKKISGVRFAEVSFATRLANIEFDANAVSIDSLKSIITNTKVKNYSYTIEEEVLIEDN